MGLTGDPQAVPTQELCDPQTTPAFRDLGRYCSGVGVLVTHLTLRDEGFLGNGCRKDLFHRSKIIRKNSFEQIRKITSKRKRNSGVKSVVLV